MAWNVRAAMTRAWAAGILPRGLAATTVPTLLTVMAAAILLGLLMPRLETTGAALDAAKIRPTPAPISRAHAVPSVEPSVFPDVDPRTARELNTAISYAALGPDRAPPFRLKSENPDFARALDCLASAVLYEAGDDPAAQAAVAQVVLNRMRHPAFPHSVCAVVYQGSERATGCQFTFTCDGALRRIPSATTWARARATAAAFLNGRTEPAVGLATHYHTDWVHPYWSTSLDKIARVETHLFFRWRGMWGRRSAFSSPYAGGEPREGKLAFLSPAHQDSGALEREAGVNGRKAGSPQAGVTGMLRLGEGDHFILVDGGGDGTELALQGLRHCAGQNYCKVIGWDRRSQDYGSPQHPVLRTVAFLFVSDKRTGVEMVLWDCARFNRPSDSQCLSDRNRRWISFQGDLSRAS
jgi:spore germination cell wall hydrolase CwlJ-like protein